MKKTSSKIIAGIVLLLAILALAAGIYVNDYYHSDDTVNVYLSGAEGVQVTAIDEGLWINGEGEENALIFYPGAKVEYTAYLPLLIELAQQGVDSFLIKMPGNLAFLGMNKADDIMQQYASYEHWYMAGHSLGGAMAAAYASEHIEQLDGLVLLAAYPTKSLASDTFKVVSIYGSEDGVLNMDKVEEGRQWMPAHYTEVCIEGGNHGQFGSYGVQKGDGEALIDAKEQRNQTIEAIIKMIELF